FLGLLVPLFQLRPLLDFAGADFPAVQAGEDFARASPAVEALAQDALDGVEMFLLRPEQAIGLDDLPGVLDGLAEDEVTGARMRIAPSSERVLTFGEKVRHRADDVAQLRLGWREWHQLGQTGQCVADDVRLGITDV